MAEDWVQIFENITETTSSETIVSGADGSYSQTGDLNNFTTNPGNLNYTNPNTGNTYNLSNTDTGLNVAFGNPFNIATVVNQTINSDGSGTEVENDQIYEMTGTIGQTVVSNSAPPDGSFLTFQEPSNTSTKTVDGVTTYSTTSYTPFNYSSYVWADAGPAGSGSGGGSADGSVITGNGSSLSNLSANGLSIGANITAGLATLADLKEQLAGPDIKRFLNVIDEEAGITDNIALGFSPFQLNDESSTSKLIFGDASEALGVAANAAHLIADVEYLRQDPNGPKALEKTDDAGENLSGLIGFAANAPGAAAAGTLISAEISAGLAVQNGDYAQAARYVAKAVTVFGFTGIGALLSPENPGTGADVGAAFGAKTADLLNSIGEHPDLLFSLVDTTVAKDYFKVLGGH